MIAPLAAACRAAGLDPAHARILHQRANTVAHLPGARAVVRLRNVRGSVKGVDRIATSVRVCRWLIGHGYPATPPLDLDPVTVDGWVASFWAYLPQPTPRPTPDVADLGRLLRRLHDLGGPPVTLPTTNPLGSLLTDLDHDGHRLRPDQRAWLREHAAQIAADYRLDDIPLGVGLVHGDGRTGNLLQGPHGWLLGDWDGAARGPRVHDLVSALIAVRRFGSPGRRWTNLCDAYGVSPDIASHSGVRLLAHARELRSLASYLRTPGRAEQRELQHRLDTLMTGGTGRWTEQ